MTERLAEALSEDGHPLQEIETPALVVDRLALEQNIERMAEAARRAGVALRPHAKTHKSPHIAELQVRAGAAGIACATIAEAEALASAGIGGLLITAPMMGAAKLARAAGLNRASGLTVVVDHMKQVEGLLGVLRSGDPKLGVAVDIDVGQRRTGVDSISEALGLSRAISGSAALEFSGIQGFAGHAQHIVDPVERRTAAGQASARLKSLADALSHAGLPPRLITGSGTGTYSLDAGHPYNELQAGSYVFMDSDYARVIDEAGAGPSFIPSLFVLATVVSANIPGQVTVDAGTKALATNGPPPRDIIGVPSGADYHFAGDEHGIVRIPAAHRAPPLGTRLLIGATHCDPTVNLHARFHVVKNGEVEQWPITGRHEN